MYTCRTDKSEKINANFIYYVFDSILNYKIAMFLLLNQNRIKSIDLLSQNFYY